MLFKTMGELTCVFFTKEEIKSILVSSGELTEGMLYDSLKKQDERRYTHPGEGSRFKRILFGSFKTKTIGVRVNHPILPYVKARADS